jgi:hypothetical protein
MREYLELGPVPSNEECYQTGKDDYILIRSEASIYKKQLERMFPDLWFSVKAFDHEFGTYCEVVVYYNPDDEAEVNKVYEVESNLPQNWDLESLKQLEELKIEYAKQ